MSTNCDVQGGLEPPGDVAMDSQAPATNNGVNESTESQEVTPQEYNDAGTGKSIKHRGGKHVDRSLDDDNDDDAAMEEGKPSSGTRARRGILGHERRADEDGEEDDNDDDSVDEHSETSGSPSDQDDDGGDDDDHDDSEDDTSNKGELTKDGLSAYERLRLERIKRNQERLSQLGLLGPRLTNQKSHRRKSIGERDSVEKRETLSRRSKQKEVDYSGVLDLRTILGETPPTGEKKAKEKPKKERKEKKTKERLERFIYDEFSRIKSHRRLNLAQAKRNYKQSEREVRHWRDEVHQIVAKAKLRSQRERQARQEAEERALLGGITKQELMNEIDRRSSELARVVVAYDMQKSEQQQALVRHQALVEQHKKKQALERKMEMVEALDRFPKAYNDAIFTLNALLFARSPKDPPPPRRSKRSRDEVGTTTSMTTKQRETNGLGTPTKKRAKTTDGTANSSSPIEGEAEEAWTNVAASLAATMAFRDPVYDAKQSADVDPSLTPASSSNDPSTKYKQQKKQKDARNIGGWISPHFAQELDRTWLSRIKPLKPVSVVPPGAVGKGENTMSFDLQRWVPQVGDVVLYYPSAHKDFLKVYPDKLGSQLRNLLRVPLWQRAKRAISRKKAGVDGAGDGSTWWTDEWVQSLVSRSDDNTSTSSSSPSLGDYPIICRVERTHAEFPPDPYAKEKSVKTTGDETTITWTGKAAEKVQSTSKTKKKRRVSIRLATLLKPLTTILPDEFLGVDDNNQLNNDHDNHLLKQARHSPHADLELPPNFTVLTAPVTSPLEPFLVPFCWAYSTFHSLSNGDPVWILNAVNDDYHLGDSETKKAGRSPPMCGKGKITTFLRGPAVEPQGENVEVGFSLRLNDKLGILEELLGNLVQTGTSLESQVKAILLKETSQRKLPFNETCILVDFLSSYLEMARGKAQDAQELGLPNVTPKGSTSLTSLIHSTLPCRHAVVVAFDSNRRQINKASPWSIIPLQPNDIARNSNHGFLGSIESSWREKSILCIEDLINNNPAADMFFYEVTEKEAPSYYCAVPVAMHFGRILERLRTPPGFVDCYYTSMDSILIDLQAIAENCMLYNSPDSQLVAACNDLISNFKKSFSTLISQHEREEKILARPKPDTSSKTVNPTLGRIRHSILTIPYNLNTPFKFPMQGNYQRFEPDGTCLDTEENSDFPYSWIPQCGDSVLYSISKHEEFVKDHWDTLSVEHRIVPDILKARRTFGDDTGDNVPPISNDDKQSEEQDGLFSHADSHWLEGTIMAIRIGFPCVPSSKEGSTSFVTHTSIFMIELRLRYSSLEDNIVVCWRPCRLKGDNSSACQPFGLTQESFLQPAWMAREGMKIIPGDLPGTSNTSIAKEASTCFDFLKRRCLNGVPADRVDRDKALENAERGISTNPGTRLPSFEEVLSANENVSSGKELSTRGTKKGADEVTIAAMYKLSDCGYLPLWTNTAASGQPDKKLQTAPLRHETLLPFPNLCLELVRLRIVHGYYRNSLAILNDISEAYVAAVFFLLYEPSTRSKDRISIRRIAKHLASPKGSGKISKSSIKKEGNTKVAEGSVKKKVPVKQGHEENKENFIDEFNPEELALIDRIYRIRKTHAFAFTCITATTQVARLFCFRFTTKAPPPPFLPENPVINSADAFAYSDEQLAAIRTIRYLLQAVGRDPCRNRFKFAYTERYKVRIKVGELITTKQGHLEKQSDGTNLFEPAFAIACLPDRPEVNVRITVSGNTVYGEPISFQQETSLAPIPSAYASALQISAASTDLPSISPMYGDDNILLHWELVDKNENLARVLFGQPGNRHPCVRCQVQGLSLLQCRVRRGHSNPDFGLVDNFKGSGGVDSALLQPWKTSKSPDQELITPPDKHEQASNQSGAAEQEVAETKSIETGASLEERAAEAKENLAKAQRAYKLSSFLYTQANLLSNAEIRLSEEFISGSFPFDPDDGHYIYCTVCGLSGNLLCCDASDCPNVVHPKCIGIDLSDIPEDDDWYCSKCVLKGRGVKNHVKPSASPPRSHVEAAVVEQTPISTVSLSANSAVKESTAQPCDEKNQISNLFESVPKAAQFTVNADGNVDSQSPNGAIPTEKAQGVSTEIPVSTASQIAAVPSEAPSATQSSPSPATQPNLVQDQVTEPQKQHPLPEITDDEVDEKLSIVNDILSELRGKREPTARELQQMENKKGSERNSDDDNDDDDAIEEEGGRTGQKRKRGRPRTQRPDEDHSNRSKKGSPVVENPLDSLGELARNFLSDISVSSGDAFLSMTTSELGDRLNQWRKKQKMKPLAGSGNVCTISAWKSIVRRAGILSNKKGTVSKSVDVVVTPKTVPPPPRSNRSIEKRAAAQTLPPHQEAAPAPRSRSSIEKRAASAPEVASDVGRPAKKQRGRPTKQKTLEEEGEEDEGEAEGRLYDSPLDNLPDLGREFCAWLGITDAQDFLDRKTGELADEFKEYRRKEKLRKLNGSGHGAYISSWKSQLRRDLAFLTAPRDDEGKDGGSDDDDEGEAKEEAEEPFVLSDEDDGDGEVEDKDDAADVDGVKVNNEVEKDDDKK